jgi:hypothetical protein
MEKYFDAFFYWANWGYRTFMLRLPSTLLDLKTARRYCSGEGASVREKKGSIVLTFAVDDDESEALDIGETSLSSLMPLRSELARGDLRALYLGWLHLVQSGSLDSGVVEPPVPAGLGQLSASLDSLVEFFRLDADLLRAASLSSEPIGNSQLKPKELRARVAKLPSAAKDDLLIGLVGGQGGVCVNPTLQEFIRKHELGIRYSDESTKRRTVRQLLRAAKDFDLSAKKNLSRRRRPRGMRKEAPGCLPCA